MDFTLFEEMDPLPIVMGIIDLEEVQSAIERFKNHKAAGEDRISAELLKATTDDNLEQWLTLYNEIWELEKILKD